MSAGFRLAVLALLTFPADVRAQTPIDTASASAGSEQLRPGDVVKLRIWREPDLSGEFPVDEAGEVTLPKVGLVQVGGVSRDSLRRALVSQYSTFLRNPSIEVTLLRRVNVMGSVQKPGLYPVDPTMTVADALALAGGPSGDGKQDQVELRRGGEKIAVELTKDTRLADTPIRAGDQLYVPQRSWLSRHTGLVFGSITFATGLIISLTN